METGFGTGGYHSGVSGAEKAPQNYAIDPTQAGDMSRTVFGGMARGMAMSDDLLKSKIEAMQQEQQAAMAQELANVSNIQDPNARTQEMARLAIKYPSLAAPFKASQDMLGPIQQQARINRLMPVHAALNSGNTDAAVKELQTQADALRNSGNESDAQSTENMIKTIQAGKVGVDSINTSMGMVLASVQGSDKYLENFMKIQKAPVDLAKEQAQTNEANAKADAARNPKPEKTGTFEQALNLYNQGKDTPVPATDKGFVSWYTNMAHPKAAAAPGAGSSAAAGVDIATAIDQAATAFVQGRGKWPSSRELKDEVLGPAIIKARAMDPTLNQATFTLRQNAQKEADTGKIGQSNNSIYTVMGHMGHLVDVKKEIPDTGFKGLNWAKGMLQEQGPGGNPQLQTIRDLVEGIGPEMAKAYIPGQGTEGERSSWKERINPFRPNNEFKAGLSAMSSMLINKLNQNEAQYSKAFKGLSANAMPPPPSLTDDAYQALKNIQDWTGKPIPGAKKWLDRYEATGGVVPTPTYSTPGASTGAALPAKPRSVIVDY